MDGRRYASICEWMSGDIAESEKDDDTDDARCERRRKRRRRWRSGIIESSRDYSGCHWYVDALQEDDW